MLWACGTHEVVRLDNFCNGILLVNFVSVPPTCTKNEHHIDGYRTWSSQRTDHSYHCFHCIFRIKNMVILLLNWRFIWFWNLYHLIAHMVAVMSHRIIWAFKKSFQYGVTMERCDFAKVNFYDWYFSSRKLLDMEQTKYLSYYKVM